MIKETCNYTDTIIQSISVCCDGKYIVIYFTHRTFVSNSVTKRLLTFCTPMSSVTRNQFLSQKFLCRVPLDVLSVPPLFMKRAEEKQDFMLEIVSRYIIHLKITKCNNSLNKTGI